MTSRSKSDNLLKDGHGLVKDVGGLPTWWEGGEDSALALGGSFVTVMEADEAIDR